MLFSQLSWTSLVLLGIGFYTALVFIQLIIDPLRDIPGPLLARFTRLWYFYNVWKGDFEKVNIALHKQYGPIVRISPNEYSIDDPEAAKTIYGPGTAFVKGTWYWAWTRLFANRDPHDHSRSKRKVASAYSMTSIVSYEPFVNNCTAILSRRLSELADAKANVDIGHWLQCYAMDVIGEITFGNRFGFLDMNVDESVIFGAIENRTLYATIVGIFPWLHRWADPWMPAKGGSSFVRAFANEQLGIKYKASEEKTMTDDGPTDQSTRFIKIHVQDPERMTKLDISLSASSNVFAGSDTTGITLSAVFYNLMKNPSTYQRLRDELDTAAKEGRISDPITFKESQDLKYFQAVIKETLRIHSAVGLTLPRIVPSGGATLAGRFFSAGTTVGINPWVAHRNKSVFGADADVWRPERWLEFEEQGKTAEVERYNLAFGAGSRSCIGKHISLLEINKLVPILVRKFEFKLSDRLQSNDVDTCNRWFVKHVGFEGTVEKRK